MKAGAPAQRSVELTLLWIVFLAVSISLQQGCSRNGLARAKVGTSQRGLASWYGPKFHGRPTASGEIYDMEAMTAAHKTLPLGTVVDVELLPAGRRGARGRSSRSRRDAGRTVRVRINDRGPFVRGRVIDLSRAAARELGLLGQGVAEIELRVVQLGRGRAGPRRSAGYTVQVGAFRGRQHAEAMRARSARLADAPAEIHREGSWYKVRVGRGLDWSDAEALRDRLQKQGLSALILPDE